MNTINELNYGQLVELIQCIDICSNEFEENKTKEAYSNLVIIIDRLQALFDINYEKNNKDNENNAELKICSINDKLTYLLHVVEQGNPYLIGDVLQFEIKPIIKKIIKQ